MTITHHLHPTTRLADVHAHRPVDDGRGRPARRPFRLLDLVRGLRTSRPTDTRAGRVRPLAAPAGR